MRPTPEQKKDWVSVLKRNNALTRENIGRALNHVKEEEERLALLAEHKRLEAKYSTKPKRASSGGFGVRNRPVQIPQEHQFFIQSLPYKPYCTNNLENGLLIRPMQTALTYKYIQYNSPAVVQIVVFDIDRQVDDVGYFQRHNAQKPNRIVKNPVNGHAHALYFLNAGVCRSDAARLKPLRYLAAIEGALCRQLQADPSFAGMITKNPLHPNWETVAVHDHLFSLGELAAGLDLKAANEKNYCREAGVGRNVTAFDSVRFWAYSAVREHWGPGGFQGWIKAVEERVAGVNCQFPTPLPISETTAIAKSIAKWTWGHLTPAGFHEAQAARGRKSGAARRASSEQGREQARLMHAQGMTQRAIADALGVTQQAISKWLHN